jgi:hypothetical protein
MGAHSASPGRVKGTLGDLSRTEDDDSMVGMALDRGSNGSDE